jgi:hypothetical protein
MRGEVEAGMKTPLTLGKGRLGWGSTNSSLLLIELLGALA